VVGGEDALRLKGSKLLEAAPFEKVWKLMREPTVTKLDQRHKNTPDLSYKPDIPDVKIPS
jgi:hypothetical protein